MIFAFLLEKSATIKGIIIGMTFNREKGKATTGNRVERAAGAEAEICVQ